ncbi:MAG: geranylgeranylglyceryl/heptaprenylglyceryl phosphate synthase [Chitinophagales bacterium]
MYFNRKWYRNHRFLYFQHHTHSANKPEIAACTALAGEQLGLQCIYLEAGSGALHAVSKETIQAVRKMIKGPLIVGGGIRSKTQVETAFKAGADIVVIGTAIENKVTF